MRELKDLSLNITEPEYRELPYLSYSAIARYAKEGFNCLSKLDEKLETPSLTFGSMVDTLITEGSEAFNSKFVIAKEINAADGVKNIIKEVFSINNSSSLVDIDKDTIISIARTQEYRNNWKDDTLYNHIIKEGSEYYDLLKLSVGKILVSSDEYAKALAVYDCLKTNELTKHYFKDNNPFDDTVKRYYQLKFVTDWDNGMPTCKCMFDLIIVNYETMEIIPCDLKTTSRPEYEFSEVFIKYRYDIQGSLYSKILKNIISKDEYFKDFTIKPFKFIVVNKESLNPLIWEFDYHLIESPLIIGDITLNNVYDLILNMTEEKNRELPIGVTNKQSNNIIEKLKQKYERQ